MVHFDGDQELFREVLEASENARLHGRENRAEVKERIFDGRAAHRDHAVGLDRAKGPRLLGRLVFEGLRFVEHEDAPALLRKNLGVAARRPVGGEKHVGTVFGERSRGAVIDPDREIRRELRDFALPVREKRRRHDGQGALFREFPLFLHAREGGDHLKRFAEPHVVGDEGPEPQAVVLHEPRVASLLIGTKRRRERRGKRFFVDGAKRRQTGPEIFGNVDLHALGLFREEHADLRHAGSLLFKTTANDIERRRIEIDEAVVERHDLACVLRERLELFLREAPPTHFDDEVVVGEAFKRHGAFLFHRRAARRDRRETRRQEFLQALREHDANAQEFEKRHGLKEKLAQSLLFEVRGLAARGADLFEDRHRAGGGGERLKDAVALLLPSLFLQDRAKEDGKRLGVVLLFFFEDAEVEGHVPFLSASDRQDRRPRAAREEIGRKPVGHLHDEGFGVVVERRPREFVRVEARKEGRFWRLKKLERRDREKVGEKLRHDRERRLGRIRHAALGAALPRKHVGEEGRKPPSEGVDQGPHGGTPHGGDEEDFGRTTFVLHHPARKKDRRVGVVNDELQHRDLGRVPGRDDGRSAAKGREGKRKDRLPVGRSFLRPFKAAAAAEAQFRGRCVRNADVLRARREGGETFGRGLAKGLS